MLRVTQRTTKEQICEYAESELGAKLDDSLKKDELVAQVRELEKEAGIFVDDGDTGDNHPDNDQGGNSKPPVEPKAEKGKGDPVKAVIMIHQPAAPDEESEPDTHCTIGLNGRNYQVAYGQEVTVPYGVYDILKNAKQVKYFAKKDPQTGQSYTDSKEQLRYPFSLIRFVYAGE